MSRRTRNLPAAHEGAIFGIVFCGPPGQFTVWLLTPAHELLSRESAEFLGQLGLRSGAIDYRIFELEGENRDWALSAALGLPLATPSTLARFAENLRESDGLPPSVRP